MNRAIGFKFGADVEDGPSLRTIIKRPLSGQGLRSHGVQGVNWPPLIQVLVHIWHLTSHFLSGFSLSRPVNPKHNVLVGWCSAAVLQWLENKFCLNP